MKKSNIDEFIYNMELKKLLQDGEELTDEKKRELRKMALRGLKSGNIQSDYK